MRLLENRKRENHISNPFFGKKIQKKLKTGTVGDKHEVEADKTADKVVNNTSSDGLLQKKSDEELQQKPISKTISSVQTKELKKEEEKPIQKKEKEEEKPVQKKSDKKEEEKPVQKKEKEEEKPIQKKSEKKEEEKPVQEKEKEEEKPVQAKCNSCEKEEKVQKKEQNSATEIQDNNLEEKLNQSKGSGTDLDNKTKPEMESGFGADFSKVKIHTDTNAIQMCQELGAQAFTNGNDVYFNKGKYNPDTKEGKHLLAHELTHTIQQTGAVQKSADSVSDSKDLEATRFKGDHKLEQTHDNLDFIAVGSKGKPVQKIQSSLMDLGYNLPKFGADGDFGSETKTAVLNFQSDNGLTYDGIVGGQTMGRLDDIHVGKEKGKKEKKPTKKDCDLFNRFQFSSEPVHIEPLNPTKDCKSFSITLTTVKNKDENLCPTYTVVILDSSGTAVKGPMNVTVGKTFTFNFTAATMDKFSMVISTPHSCGENAFTGKGTKHRQ